MTGLALVLGAGLAVACVVYVALPFLREPEPVRDRLDEPDELERLRANARQAARQVNWEQEEAKLNALVRDLVAR